jgi:hypothetical protein
MPKKSGLIPLVQIPRQAFNPITMEATRLANKLTTVLAPALPFLLPVSQTSELDTRDIPQSALDADRSIWQKISPRTSDHPHLLEAAQHLAFDSHDSSAQAEFQHELRDLLAEDASLFEDLKKEVIHHCVLHHFDAPPTGARAAN